MHLGGISVLLSLTMTSSRGAGLLFRVVPANVDQVKEVGYTESWPGSLVECAMRAGQYTKSRGVFCYGDEGACITPTGDLYPVRGPTTPGWDCYKAEPLDCGLPDGTMLALYDVVPDPRQCSTVCALSGLAGALAAQGTTPLSCCSVPFTTSSGGCLLLDTTHKINWCGARDTCRWRGGYLFTASDEQHLSDVSAIMRGANDNAYVNVRRLSGSWFWGDGREVQPAEWDGSDYPNTGDCAWLYLPTGKLRNTGDCSVNRNYLCQAFVSTC